MRQLGGTKNSRRFSGNSFKWDGRAGAKSRGLLGGNAQINNLRRFVTGTAQQLARTKMASERLELGWRRAGEEGKGFVRR
jgi:hypothetical protein